MVAGGVVLLNHGVGLEHIVGERLGVEFVERDHAVGLQNVRIQHVYLLAVLGGDCVGLRVLGLLLLQVPEVLGHEQDRVLRSVLEQEGDGISEEVVNVLLLYSWAYSSTRKGELTEIVFWGHVVGVRGFLLSVGLGSKRCSTISKGRREG